MIEKIFGDRKVKILKKFESFWYILFTVYPALVHSDMNCDVASGFNLKLNNSSI